MDAVKQLIDQFDEYLKVVEIGTLEWIELNTLLMQAKIEIRYAEEMIKRVNRNG